MKYLSLVLFPLALMGCTLLDNSDTFGAEWDIGIGGILSYVADVHVKGKVGFSKSCHCHRKVKKKDPQTGEIKEVDDDSLDEVAPAAAPGDPLGVRHFL